MISAMIHVLTANWWALALRGLLAIVFGVLTFIQPGITLTFLALIFGCYALLDGVFSLIAAFRGAGKHSATAPGRWWLLLLEGVLGIVAGVFTFVATPVTVIALVYLIAAWAIVTGVLEIGAAIRLRAYLKGEWLLALMGSASVIVGVLLLTAPIAGAVVIAYWIGGYAIIFGVLMLLLAFRLKSHPRLAAPPA